MKNKKGFAVAYNPQTAVDFETHLKRREVKNDWADTQEGGIYGSDRIKSN